jgi:hypothetical protein
VSGVDSVFHKRRCPLSRASSKDPGASGESCDFPVTRTFKAYFFLAAFLATFFFAAFFLALAMLLLH